MVVIGTPAPSLYDSVSNAEESVAQGLRLVVADNNMSNTSCNGCDVVVGYGREQELQQP